MNRGIYILIIILLQVSCSNNKITADLQKVYGQQIVLPTAGQWRVQNRDTTYSVSNDKPKVVVYYNAEGCTSCRLKELLDWKALLTREASAPSDSSNVEFMFIFATGNDKQSLTESLLQYDFKHPVLCDTQKEFEAMNLLPENEIFHCFLLDKSNKVALVGSPLGSPKMQQLYKQVIAEINNKVR